MFIMILDACVAINGAKSLDLQRRSVVDFAVLANLKLLASNNFRQTWVCMNLAQAKQNYNKLSEA